MWILLSHDDTDFRTTATTAATAIGIILVNIYDMNTIDPTSLFYSSHEL